MAGNSTNAVNTPQATAREKDLADTATPIDDSIDPENEIFGARLLIIHIGVTLSSFLAGLDSNLMATSVPVITSRFNSIDDVGWYGASFYIAMCASQPLAGKIYTLFSKKLTFLFYLFIFESRDGTLSFWSLPRFVGGIVILATIIPLHKRAIWQGTQITMYSVASVIGPVIGGALTQSVPWRWCFYINLPFGALAAVLLIFSLQIRKPEEATHLSLFRKLKALDLFGFVLLAGSITMLLLPLQLGGITYSWSSSEIIGLFVGPAVTLIPFIGWQVYRGDNALVPPRLFGYRNASLLCLCQMFTAGPFQVIIYWLPVWFQAVLGVSPIASGVRYLPTVVADALTCIIGSGIIMQLGIWNPFLLLAKALISISGGLLSAIHPSISSGHWIGYQILGGCGYGLMNNVGHIGMQASIPKELVPIGAGSLMSVLSATCAIFLAAGQAIFQDRLAEHLSGKVSSDLIARILDSGATNIRSFTSHTDLPVILEGYSKSISQVFYLPAAAPVLGFFIALGLEWTPLKQKAGTPIATEKADSESNVENKV